MKLKSGHNWLGKGLLIVIILGLLALLIVKLMYMPFNKADFHNIIMPIISVLGFIAVIISIWYVKKGNDERLSQEYYNFYVEKIEKYKQRMNDEKIRFLTASIKTEKTDTIYNFLLFLFILQNQIRLDFDYEEDLQKIKDGKKLNTNYFQKRSYFKPLFDMQGLVLIVGGFAHSNYRLLSEINLHRRLTDDHIELLSRQILSELLKDYLIACHRLFPIPDHEGIINLFKNDKEIIIINKFFFIPYEIISKDDKLKKLSSSEGIKLD